MKIIINGLPPISIYWNYTEFWRQQRNKDIAGITVRCFVKKGEGENSIFFKEKVVNIFTGEGYTNEDKAKGRRDSLQLAVNSVFSGSANKDVRRAIWKAYLESQHGNINGTRMKAKDIIFKMNSCTEQQLDMIRARFFNKTAIDDAGKLVEMKLTEHATMEA